MSKPSRFKAVWRAVESSVNAIFNAPSFNARLGKHRRDWLRAAGFAEVDVAWMYAGHAIFTARRPAA